MTVAGAAATPGRGVPAGRDLAVLDVDNLVAPWWEHEDEVLVEVLANALGALPEAVEVVAAATHRVARRVGALDLAGRVATFERVRARPEAADRVLLAALRDWEPAEGATAWLGSGDRRFAGACGRLRRAGATVVVLAPSAGLSPQLRRRADRLLDLRRAHVVDVTDD